MHNFYIGDIVEVKKDSPYSITTAGSQGVIKEIYSNYLLIHFHKLTSGKYGESDYGKPKDTYSIEVRHVKHTADYVPKTKQEIIIDKIKVMEVRFQTRNQWKNKQTIEKILYDDYDDDYDDYDNDDEPAENPRDYF